MKPTIVDLDFADPAQTEALAEILDAYAREPGGQSAPLSERARGNLARGLAEHPAAFALLALVEGRAVGAAVCFWGFSTFAGQPLLNLHDFAVLPEARGRGVGRGLLAELERRARERGCCKITLEVQETNERAKALYRREGFGPWSTHTLFVTKPLPG